MLNIEIKEKIDMNNELIEKAIMPNKFTLNTIVADLLDENKKLQDQCSHEFKDGYCVYCYKGEND